MMTDECTHVATVWQMSVCIRFADDKLEFFLGLLDAEAISASLLISCDLDLSNVRGQGYNCTSVMAGKVSGVSARLQE